MLVMALQHRMEEGSIMSKFVVPDHRLVVPLTAFYPGRLSEWSRERVYWWLHRSRLSNNDIRRLCRAPLREDALADRVVPLAPIMGGAGSFSDWYELRCLDLLFHKSDLSGVPLAADPYLGLWTVTTTLDDTSTGSTANECTYTTYARAPIANTSMNAPSANSISNGTAITFSGYTSGSTTCTQWMVTTTVTTGNSLVYGTCTSTTIDSTHNPATVAIGALTVTLD